MKHFSYETLPGLAFFAAYYFFLLKLIACRWEPSFALLSFCYHHKNLKYCRSNLKLAPCETSFFGDQSECDKIFGDQSECDKIFGDQSECDKIFGDQSECDKIFGDQSECDKIFGDQSECDKIFGDQSECDKIFGDQSE